MQTKTMKHDDYAEVLELLETYYNGLYRLDIAKLRQTFSPSASYATIANGALLQLSIDDYFPRLAGRDAPADDGIPYEYHVISVRFAGKDTALAVLECSLFEHNYTDLLSLLRIDGRWRIQAKVFEGVPSSAKEVS